MAQDTITLPKGFVLEDEAKFQKWYSGHAQDLGLDPNPDDPRHFYDYRAAFYAGVEPDETGHFSSKYKLTGHPRTIVEGVNTITGEMITPPEGFVLDSTPEPETPEEAGAKAEQALNWAVDYEAGVNEVEDDYDEFMQFEAPADPTDISPPTNVIIPSAYIPPKPRQMILTTPTEKTSFQKVQEFFTGKPEQKRILPEDASPEEKFKHVLQKVFTLPLWATFKAMQGLSLNSIDVAWAALKKTLPKDMQKELRGKNLDDVIAEGLDYDPPGFSLFIGEVANFVGGLNTVGKFLPKAAAKYKTVMSKALEQGEKFAVAAVFKELSRFGAEKIDPKTDYNYRGAAQVVASFGIGLGFSLIGQAGSAVGAWAMATPTGRAITDAFHKVVFDVSKNFPKVMDIIRPEPDKFFTDKALEYARLRWGDLTPREKLLSKHAAREAQRRFLDAYKEYIKAHPISDIVTAKGKAAPSPPVPKALPAPLGEALAKKPVYPPEAAGVAPTSEIKGVKPEKGKIVAPAPSEAIEGFHGGKVAITEFDEKRVGERDFGFFGKGFYFSDKEGIAAVFAETAAGEVGGGAVTKASLDIKNPLRATPQQLRERYPNATSTKGFLQFAEEEGFDGLIVTLESGNKEIVVPNKSQITLAPTPTAEPKGIEKPTDTAISHTVERNIPAETEAEIKQAKKSAKLKPGFARIPSLAEFQEISDKLKATAGRITEPQRDVITSAHGAIEKWRAETNRAGLFADWAKRSLKEMKATSKQLDTITRYIDDPKAYKDQFSKLPDDIKEMATVLTKDFKDMWQIAKDEDILESWLENYIPHIYKDSETRIMRTLYPQGGKMGTKFRFAKQRKISTLDEAEKLGLHPVTDPILLNSVYKYQLYKVIANKNLVETLKQLKREDGMPLMMGRPKKPDKLKVWENEYEWVNVPGLQRWLYVGQIDEKGMLIKMPVKAEPELAKILNDAFSPWAGRTAISKAYHWVRGRIKRIIMLNPLIHGTNIYSDVLDEMNFRPLKTIKTMVRGGELYKKRDAIVERAVNSGLQITNIGLARDLRKVMLESSESLRGALAPLGKLEEKSDEILWNNIVRNSQIGLFEALTYRMGREHPDWAQEKIDQTVSTYINTLLGTLPHTWFSKAGREASGAMFFARNWTVSNIDMVVKAVSGGRKGLGMKALPRDQQKQIAMDYTKHLFKGVFGLLAFANILQLGFLTITNKMKKDGKLEGEPVDLHTTFGNEDWKHWVDVDTGLKTKTGQTIYLVPPLFRYIRDYFGWATEPAKTFLNKMEPLLKQGIEQIGNYSLWKREAIVKQGTPTIEGLKKRAEYFIKGITPSQFYAHKPGRIPTTFEWLIPFTGTWIRRGAPGGKFTSLMWKFRSEEGYEREQVDIKIDEHLQKGEFQEAFTLMRDTERYASLKGGVDRVVEMVAPLNFYWGRVPDKEKDRFLDWLESKGHKIEDLQEALQKEMSAVSAREDAL